MKILSQTLAKSLDQCSFSKMELNTKASGIPIAIIVMEEDIKFGLTEAYMKATGRLIKLMVEED